MLNQKKGNFLKFEFILLKIIKVDKIEGIEIDCNKILAIWLNDVVQEVYSVVRSMMNSVFIYSKDYIIIYN